MGLLTDLTATLIVVPPVVGGAALSSYQVGVGAAIPDGVVGFTIDGLDISFIPGAGAAVGSIGQELANLVNAAGANHTATDNGSGLVMLTDKRLSDLGNAVVILDVTTDTGVAPGTVVDPSGGATAKAGGEFIEVDDGLNPIVRFTRMTLVSNSSLVRRALLDNGWAHNLEKGTTQQMLSHAIATRILEQL